jgi:hypothetical protein
MRRALTLLGLLATALSTPVATALPIALAFQPTASPALDPPTNPPSLLGIVTITGVASTVGATIVGVGDCSLNLAVACIPLPALNPNSGTPVERVFCVLGPHAGPWIGGPSFYVAQDTDGNGQIENVVGSDPAIGPFSLASGFPAGTADTTALGGSLVAGLPLHVIAVDPGQPVNALGAALTLEVHCVGS